MSVRLQRAGHERSVKESRQTERCRGAEIFQLRIFRNSKQNSKKVRPALGDAGRARTRSGDGEGWGRDRTRVFLVQRVDVAVAYAGLGSPSETQLFGLLCDCRFTKR